MNEHNTSTQYQSLVALLGKAGLTPNKALGQNFLIDSTAIKTIIDAAQIDGKNVLEIGPGLGALTESLLERAEHVAAVEIDRAMAAVLQERFNERLILYREDILKSDLPAIRDVLGGGELCVLGNLPYYITTPICLMLLKHADFINSMTLMVQEEAAQRFFAQPGERVYGALAVLSQAYYTIENVLSLAPESYYPQPEVNSRVVRLSRNAQACVEHLPALIRAAFSMRRKTLLNNLKAAYPDAERVREALRLSELDLSIRAEALSAEDYLRLASALL